MPSGQEQRVDVVASKVEVDVLAATKEDEALPSQPAVEQPNSIAKEASHLDSDAREARRNSNARSARETALARFAAEVAKLQEGVQQDACAEVEEQQLDELQILGDIYGESLHLDGDTDNAKNNGGSSCDQRPSLWPRTLRLELPVEVTDGVELLVDTTEGSIHAGKCETLPPMVLFCALPFNYPAGGGRPVLAVCAEHLSAAEVAKIEADLGHISRERPEESVLFELASHLQECGAAPTSLMLGSGDAAMEIALGLLAADQRIRYEKRGRELQQCPVCFDDVLGARGLFLECGHFGCRPCLGQMAQLHTGEADIGALRCPVTDCRKPFGFEALRELLGADSLALARWEELSLQQCLDKMQDVAYCPRCDLEGSGKRVPCIQDEDGMAQCEACEFAFCGRCRDPYHPGQPCASRDDRMDALEMKAGGQGPEAKAAREELATLRQLARTTKACPTCKSAIEKSEGCSKMHCRVCDSNFCWRCGKSIEGYDHFASGACKLFDDEEIRRWNANAHHVLRAEARAHEARFLAQFLDPKAVRVHCPQCKAGNVREGRNNHLRCHACQNPFCAKCGMILPKNKPGEHFMIGRGGCPQHSD